MQEGQWGMEILQCGMCPSHIKRWECEQLQREMYHNGATGGYVLCRPCAEHYGMVHNKAARSCPYPCSGSKQTFANCPWQKKSIPEPPLKDVLFARLYDKHNERLERKIADLIKQFPLEDHEKLKNMIIEEVNKEYHTEYAALVANGEP